jgi:hypothetical protein
VYASVCEKAEVEERRSLLFAMVILSSLSAGSLRSRSEYGFSPIDRIPLALLRINGEAFLS